MAASDTDQPVASEHRRKRTRKMVTPQDSARPLTPAKVTLRVAPREPNPEWVASLQQPAAGPTQEESMNATTFAQKLHDGSFEQVSSWLRSAFGNRAKNSQAVADAFLAGLNGAAEVRAHLVATASQMLSDQIAAAAQFSKVTTPDEAFKLQQQLALQAWATHAARARDLGEVLWAAWQASAQPLTERYSEVSKTATS